MGHRRTAHCATGCQPRCHSKAPCALGRIDLRRLRGDQKIPRRGRVHETQRDLGSDLGGRHGAQPGGGDGHRIVVAQGHFAAGALHDLGGEDGDLVLGEDAGTSGGGGAIVLLRAADRSMPCRISASGVGGSLHVPANTGARGAKNASDVLSK